MLIMSEFASQNENAPVSNTNLVKDVKVTTRRQAFSELQENRPIQTQQGRSKVDGKGKPEQTFQVYDETDQQNEDNNQTEPIEVWQRKDVEQLSTSLVQDRKSKSPMLIDEEDSLIADISDDEPVHYTAQHNTYDKDNHIHLKEAELKYQKKYSYMSKQKDLSASMRQILCDWLNEVSEEYKLTRETLHLAVNYVDRFLARMMVARGRLQLVGTAAMFLASKFEEIYPPDVAEFVYVTDDTYTKKHVLRMEHLILKTLDFNLAVPTPLVFLNFYNDKVQASTQEKHLSHYFCDLTLIDLEFLKYKPSEIAASAIIMARHTIAPTLQREQVDIDDVLEVSKFEISSLRDCIDALHLLHLNSNSLTQQSVQEKYASASFGGVSACYHPLATSPTLAISDDGDHMDVDN